MTQFDSIREQIMQAVQTKLETMVTPDYGFAFGTVQREPLSDDMRGKKYVAYLYDETTQRLRSTDPVTYAKIQCILEYAVIVGKDENPNTLLNLVCSEVERRLMADVTLGGLSYEIEFLKDEKAIGWRFDKGVEGAIYFTISYRYRTSDPRYAV